MSYDNEKTSTSQGSGTPASDSSSRVPPLVFHLRTAEDPEKLRKDYEAAGKRLNRWFWLGGGLLLLLGLCLWLWGPRERLAVPTPTAGYTFHQAGTVRGRGDTLWVWILADTAGRARVLLSADQGHQWQVRDLGVDSSRAHALALNWGAPGRGLLVGSAGRVRVLTDVFRTPLAGRDTTIGNDAKESFFSVAVDSIGADAVVLGRVVPLLQTHNGGKAWDSIDLSLRSIAPFQPEQVACNGGNLFVLGAGNKLMELEASQQPDGSIENKFSMLAWDAPLTVPVLTLSISKRNVLVTATDGTAHYAVMNTGLNGQFNLFASNLRPVALVLEDPAKLDSTLLLIKTPAGGQLRRLALAAKMLAGGIRSHALNDKTRTRSNPSSPKKQGEPSAVEAKQRETKLLLMLKEQEAVLAATRRALMFRSDSSYVQRKRLLRLDAEIRRLRDSVSNYSIRAKK